MSAKKARLTTLWLTRRPEETRVHVADVADVAIRALAPLR